MTRFKLIAVLFISFIIISCQKDKNELEITGEGANLVQGNLPHYDETNSKLVRWNQFPSELKNAIPLDSLKAKKATGSQTSARMAYGYSIGPWGGNGGSAFSWLPPPGDKLYAIAVSAGSYIDKISVWYRTPFGLIYRLDAGGKGGTAYYIQYLSSSEYISKIDGRAGNYVDYLKFSTNLKTFGYGGPGGTPFSASVPSYYHINGFFGRAGNFIDKIGVYVYTR